MSLFSCTRLLAVTCPQSPFESIRFPVGSLWRPFGSLVVSFRSFLNCPTSFCPRHFGSQRRSLQFPYSILVPNFFRRIYSTHCWSTISFVGLALFWFPTSSVAFTLPNVGSQFLSSDLPCPRWFLSVQSPQPSSSPNLWST